MSAPALVFSSVTALAVATLAFRNRTVLPYVLAGGGAALIGVFVLYAPLDSAMTLFGFPLRLEASLSVLGRPFHLDSQNRTGVGLLFLVGALFFAGARAAAAGRSFLPAGLIALGLLCGSLTIEPFLFAAVFLELAAMACVLVLVPPGSSGDSSVLNLLVLYTLAMMAILLSGWLLENVGVTSVTPDLAIRVILLLGVGFAILLFVPPFHYWIPSVADWVNPYSLAFVAIVLQSAGMFFLLRFLDGFAWMRADPRVLNALVFAGILMIIFGSAAAIVQTSYTKMAVYVLLADMGVSLLAVGTSTPVIALGMTSVRVVSVGLWGLGTAILKSGGEFDGAGSRAPLAGAASLLGLISLIGLPMGAGFPWRWSLFTESGVEFGIGASVTLLSMLVLTLATLRWARGLFAAAAAPREPATSRLILAAASGLALLFGFLPQVALPWVANAARGFSNLSP